MHVVLKPLILLGVLFCLTAAPASHGAGFLERLGFKKRAAGPSALETLSQDQIIAGLKEALARGTEQAVASLGRTNGFLRDLSVKISLPEKLQPLAQGLRGVGQGNLVDQFETTLNRAAEQAVPEAAAVLGDAIRQMTLADARSILTATNAAATDYFKRVAGPTLQTRFLPIVQRATAQVGVTSAYKQMTARLGGLGALAGLSTAGESLDLDAYVTGRALDGLFFKIAEQERQIRTDPAARTTELLRKVFGTAGL